MKPSIFISNTVIATTVTIVLSSLTHQAFATPVPAKSADSFVDSIGVNVHLAYNAYKNDGLIKSKLQELGVRHIRDGAYQDQGFLNQLKDLSKVGIKTTLIFSGNPPEEVLSTAKKLSGTIEAVEGANESDLEVFQFAYKGEKFPEGTRIYQKELNAAIKSNSATKHLQVILPSMGWGENAQKLGYVGSLGDICNLHSYINLGQRPTADIDSYFIPHARTMCGDSLPKWVTETGYHNAISHKLGISEQAAGKYIPRVLLENFNRNIKRTYIYELFDQGTDKNDDQGNYGLIRHNGSPKQAFTTIKNLISLLKEPGAKLTPSNLDYTLSGDTQGIHSTLLQKSDGTFYLVLWQDAESWNNDEKTDVAVPSKNTKVSLASSANKIELYDPSKSASSIKSVSATQDITVSIPDHPIILKIAGSKTQPSNTNQKPQSSNPLTEQKPVEQPPSVEETEPSESQPGKVEESESQPEVEESEPSESQPEVEESEEQPE